MLPPRTAPLLLAAICAVGAQDDPPPRGMEVIPLVRKAGELMAGREPPVAGRPWSDDLAALTDPDPGTSGPAVGRLVRRGAVVLPDVAVLASDRDWNIRARVVRVAAGIGGADGAPLCLRLSRDAHPLVRRNAIVGLGRCRGDEVLARLTELIASPDSDERTYAAPSLAAIGDVRGIAPLLGLRSDPDGPARSAQATALHDLALRADALATVTGLLGSISGEQRRALLEALAGGNDTRLCPALVPLLEDHEALTTMLVSRILGSCGDWRAVGSLVRVATSDRRDPVRESATETLRYITGYRAGPGQAWTIWWQDNATRSIRLAERDAILSRLMAPDASAPTELGGFTTAELAALVEAAVGVGRPVPAWYAANAVRVLRSQGSRWIQPITDRIDAETEPELRLDLLVLLDEIGGPEARDAFLGLRERLEKREEADLKRWHEKGSAPPDTRGEHAIITLALMRRR